MSQATDESWQVLVSLFPPDWEKQAAECGAVARLRGFRSAADLMRVLLLHVGRGYSLRETSVRAKAAGWAEVSDVALLKRLRKAERWWQSLCLRLLAEQGVEMRAAPGNRRVRALDGTLVKEPGQTGSTFRIHYSLQLPEMRCDHFALTPVCGAGNGEKLHRFPAAPGDLLLADRGLCTPVGMAASVEQGADLIVRWNSGSVPLKTTSGRPFALSPRLARLTQAGQSKSWPVWIQGPEGLLGCRLCAIRKSEQATQNALQKIKRKSQQGGPAPKPQTLLYAQYVLILTTLSGKEFPSAEVLEWYRLR